MRVQNSMIEKSELESLFLTAEKFYVYVNNVVVSDDISYIDAVMQVCDTNGIDPEELVKNKLISPLLRSKLHIEAMENGMLKPESTLPML